MNNLAVNIGGAFNSPIKDVTQIGGLVSTIVSVALTLSGVIVLIFFILGGIGMIAGAGGDNPERMQKGKQTISAAAIGFVIVFAAYWIVQLIEFITGIKVEKNEVKEITTIDKIKKINQYFKKVIEIIKE